MKQKPSILVVDDEQFVRESLIELLEAEGWRALPAEGSAAALRRTAREKVDLIITDLNMPGGDGLALLKDVQQQGVRAPVIVLTGVGKIADAVSAMKGGAYDFIQKPDRSRGFLILIRRALTHADLVAEVGHLRATVQDLREGGMVGASPWFAKLKATLEQVAPSEAIVLITGESGTGKELVALEIHRRSRRARASLVRVNCAAISETLFESEFFGHRRGAYTGAVDDRVGRFSEAEGGTLVLDEIGTIRPAMQAKLLRVLESGEYQVVGESTTRVADVRVIAITNEDLAARVARGEFRADLYYRLNVFPIEVPPLRQRKQDIPVLARHLFQRARSAMLLSARAGAAELGDESVDVLLSYDWPGNVRELRNVIERSVILAGAAPPDAHLFRSILEPALRGGGSAPSAAGDAETLVLRERLDELEGKLLRAALQRTNGAKGEAAELLGIDPKNLSYYLRKHKHSDSEPTKREQP